MKAWGSTLNRGYLSSALVGVSLFFAQGAPKERWMLYDKSLLPDIEINAMAMDNTDNKWFGTRKGLVRFSSAEIWETFTMASTHSGLVHDAVLDLESDQYSDLWVGTEGGISVYSNGSWKSYTQKSTNGNLPNDFINDIAITPKDEKWFATKGGFAKLSGSSIWTTWDARKVTGLLPDANITAIYPESEGKIWLGTVTGLYLFNGSTYKRYHKENTEDGIPNNYITRIEMDGSGQLWVGTQNGVATFKSNAWKSYTSENTKGIPGDMVYGLKTDDKAVYISFRGGAAVWKEGQWRAWTKSNTAAGLPSRRVFSILPGKNGDTWFGTRDGIARLSPFRN